MSFEQRGIVPLDYHTSTLAGSPLRFRGPLAVDGDSPIVCLGGSETFGRFIHTPYPARLDAKLKRPVLNLGVVNAGLDVLADDPAIVATTRQADAVVLQITGAQNMTNRFYSVHRRRNDRFLTASAVLRTIYPDVDFTEFHFTRHLLSHLYDVSTDRFDIVRAELTTAWVARMRSFVDRMECPVHLLWLANHPPQVDVIEGLGADPLFVTQEMLEAVSAKAASLTIAKPEPGGAVAGVKGKYFAQNEEGAARLLPGPELHDVAAQALLEHLA